MADPRSARLRLLLLVRLLWGVAWRVGLIAALGALAACAFRPLAWWPAMLVGVGALAVLAGRVPRARWALLVGWLWGLGHFTLGLNWIATAFTYQAKMPAWLGGLAVLLLSAYLAVFPALAAWGAWAARRRPLAQALAFAGCWALAEALRGWLFTGFPWNPLAASLLGDFAHPGLAALLPWLGTYALSALAALLAAVVGQAVLALWQGERSPWRLAPAGAALALLALAFHGPAKAPQEGGHVAYTVVQPNIPQPELNDPTYFEDQFQKTARLSRAIGPAGPRLVLWPESGVPDFLREGYPLEYYQATTFAADPLLARLRIGRLIGPQAQLLTGSIDLIMAGNRVAGARNVVTGLDSAGRITGSYAKAHLVPYGEYLPMRWLLKPLGLERLVPGDMDFTPGPGPATLDLGVLGKAGVQICYEIIFPGAVVDGAHRPEYIFNPSNDGWFGDWGPPQHLAQARLRAIEEGLPVLRATTNGISAVVDSHGVVVQSAGRDVAARLDGTVPPALAPTPFASAGNALSLGWALLLLVAAALVLRRRER